MDFYIILPALVSVVFLQNACAANNTESTCILPPRPVNGDYVISGVDDPVPGNTYDYIALSYSCAGGYALAGSETRLCVQGFWTEDEPTCVPTKPSLSKVSSEQTGACILPPYPVNGYYEVYGTENASPNQIFDYVTLVYSCNPGYQLRGSKERLCVQGVWNEIDPKCVGSETSKPSGGTQGACILPPRPENGRYKIDGIENPTPGQTFDYVSLSYSCSPGYEVLGSRVRLCVQGVWAEGDPKCIRLCRLEKHPSVVYRCSGGGLINSYCGDTVVEGVTVTATCRTQYYRANPNNTPMKCVGGKWNHIAVCEPDCGRLPADNGNIGTPFAVPWDASVYRKSSETYLQFCGGTLISFNTVLSSAQCYWIPAISAPEPPTNFAVALGKQYRDWDNLGDRNAQKLKVIDIQIPSSYRGVASNYQDDIAVLLLSASIVHTKQVRPACIQFDTQFEKTQLQAARLGMIARWLPDSKMRVMYLPYVTQEVCRAGSDARTVSSDTLCAGYENDECSSEILFSNEQPSISPPPFSPLTPLIHELRHKNNIQGENNYDARSDTSLVLGSSPLQKDLENEDQTSSPIRAMSPKTQELFDVLNEPGFDCSNNNDFVQYPDLLSKTINNAKDDSETDCDSCDDILKPKDTQKKKSYSNNNMDNDVMQRTITEKNMSSIPIEDKLLNKTTACTSGTVLCKYNNGAGITFPADIRGVVRYFIHGVASTRTNLCNGSWLNTFTQVLKHENFIKSSIKKN